MKKVTDIEASDRHYNSTRLVIDFEILERNGLTVTSHDDAQITLQTEAGLLTNEAFATASRRLATAAGYKDPADRQMLFDAIDTVEMRIRLIQALRGV